MIRAFTAFVVAISVFWAANTNAQTAESAAKLVVDPPLAEPLSRGVAFINYRTENLQVVPVFGPQAASLSPRIGHLHVAVDGAQWVWADTSGGPIIIAGLRAYGFGYMLAVPVLTPLTDHFDARGILLIGSAVSGLATLAFGLFANGLLSASLIWAVAGAGFGGAYMPGLKALTDRLPPGDMSRSVTLYTSSFSVGVGLSFLISQLVILRMADRILRSHTAANVFDQTLLLQSVGDQRRHLQAGHVPARLHD